MIIEALATDTPVIAYDLPPINEIVESNVSFVVGLKTFTWKSLHRNPK